MNYQVKSKVEEIYLKKSDYKSIYTPAEKIKSIVVANFPVLGKLTALRFIEWLQNNPGGVISLPTGKTPEHFIKWTQYYLNNWSKKDVQKDLEENGINTKIIPDMKSFSFVQIDEFFPISPRQQNSFYYYINKYYLKGFGLDRNKALLIDTFKIGIPKGYTIEDIFPGYKVNLNLRTDYARTFLEKLQKDVICRVDQFCTEYEEKIRARGGIGFFLGGIGPDGHIGFNISGSDFFSTTRLTPINYETAAASANDLGGIEVSRNRLVITIGLATITFRLDVTVIITAAGDAKAEIVARSIQSDKDLKYPASILQQCSNSVFYLTRGAASKLMERSYIRMQKKKKVSEQDMQFHLINYTLENNVLLDRIKEADLKKDRFNLEVMKKSSRSASEIKNLVKKKIMQNIEAGCRTIDNAVIYHTSPHHDDEMLGYLPYIMHLVREPGNKNYFSYMTSGFTSVTNSYMLALLKKLKYHLGLPRLKFLISDDYFNPGYTNAYNDDIYFFLDGLAQNNTFQKDEAISRRLLRILVNVFADSNYESILERIQELTSYFKTQYPGKKDLEYIQKIKGMIREFEAELVWGYFGFESDSVWHLRLGFYTGDIFTKQPDMNRDILPIYNVLKKIRPSIITVALDPEGSGPDTHYKVLQAISEALKLYQQKTGINDIKIWGYRNVWYRFHPSEANLYIPASLNSLAVLNHSFLNCFGSQKDASFPSYEYDGPFSELAQKIIVEQYNTIKQCMGEDFFYKNKHPRLRAARGLVFMKELTMDEFYRHSMELKKLLELTK